jgi:hypothetical protein
VSTRKAWRALPLRFVLTPSLDAPVLVFPWGLESIAECYHAELEELRDRLRRAREPDRRRAIAHRARVLHLRRVAMAEGYRFPGERLVIEFARDEV